MITLVQFAPCWGLPSPSPFCLKVETFLRMVGLEYRVEIQSDPRKAPKGKLPYIKDRGKTVPDSEAILRYLADCYDVSLDGGLTDKDSAIGRAVTRLCEDHLYWVLVKSRWCDDQIWTSVKTEYFKSLPLIVRPLVSKIARQGVINSLNGQGFGRHTQEEVYTKGVQDLATIAHLLGENLYIVGEQPRSFDASVYGVLANILYCPIPSPLLTGLKKHANLISYCERIKSTYFAEY